MEQFCPRNFKPLAHFMRWGDVQRANARRQCTINMGQTRCKRTGKRGVRDDEYCSHIRSRSSSLKKRQILSAVNVARAFLGEIAFRERKTDAVQATEKCASGRSPDNADVIDRSVYRARRALFHCIRHHPLV